jgi:GntR family transcriptional regulator/MocR family aminotransferase
VLDGRLRAGERLPASRDFARQLEVARNTVAAAYERLTAEGFLTARVGAGTFVATQALPRRRRAPAGRDIRPRPIWSSITLMPPAVTQPFDFRVGIPDWRLFPVATWRRLVSAEIRTAMLRGADYADPGGYPPLRAAIARSVGISRSVRAAADDVLVTHGAQQAIDLLARVLVEPGSVVAVEEPGYPPVRELLRSHGALVVGVPVDGEGLVVSAIPRAARLVYVTPSHQFPLGTPMSLARRTELLAWAGRRGGVIIEDDYDSEYRYSDRPLEPLQSLDRSGRVSYVGSFSKTLLPMLRVGFLIAPASLQPALLAAKQLTDWRGELTTQAALARFIDDGLLARHIRKATRTYQQRYELLRDRLERDFTDWLTVVPSAAGLHLCARPRPGVDVEVVPWLESLTRYCAGAPQPGLVLGFGGLQIGQIPPALATFRAALTTQARHRPRTR